MISPQNVEARRVLIIDDNDDAAQLLAMFVEVFGHTARVANDGKDGLALAAQFMPEIVFLDLGMPGLSGFEVAPMLRTIMGLEHIYIVALTGWHDWRTRQQVIACGFDRHLVKPAAIDDIHLVLSTSGVPPRPRSS